MCSVGQGHLSLSLLPSNNQYKWDHLKLKQCRSVCVLNTCMDVGVLVSGCGYSLVPSPHFHVEARMIIGTGHKSRIWICAHVGVCVSGQNRLLLFSVES